VVGVDGIDLIGHSQQRGRRSVAFVCPGCFPAIWLNLLIFAGDQAWRVAWTNRASSPARAVRRKQPREKIVTDLSVARDIPSAAMIKLAPRIRTS